MVMEGIAEDIGDGSMQCMNHPFKNSSPGGICALCLQEKLGKLVSSSFPSAIFPSSSSSSTPSFRSDVAGSVPTSSASALPAQTVSNKPSKCSFSSDNHNLHQFGSVKKPKMIPFHRRKKKINGAESSATVFKRSKSASTPRNRVNFMEADENEDDYSPRKRGFWSFLYYSSSSKKMEKHVTVSVKNGTFASSSASVNGSVVVRDKKRERFAVMEENEGSDQATHERKVSRSRSVGCGSRSFSGDFFERISTGFGDCTLRRVESQREGKPKLHSSVHHRNSGASGQDCIRERVKCGGIFSGFMITASSSASSDWISEDNVNGRATISPASVEHYHHHHPHQIAHGRSRKWGWALASPMRAFSKPSSGKSQSSNKNTTPNLSAIPSLLTVRS